jgi:hypothetical protein
MLFGFQHVECKKANCFEKGKTVEHFTLLEEMFGTDFNGEVNS